MSEVNTIDTTNTVQETDKLTSLFNEEIYIRMDAGSIPASKFKIYDDILEVYKTSDRLDQAKTTIEEHLAEHSESISAKYLLMIISLIRDVNSLQETPQLKSLLEQFRSHGKWVIIEYITDNITKYDPNNKIALRFKAEALEKLKKNKELKIVLEKLAKLDRKNPEIQKKYALSILEEDKDEAIKHLKKAVEEFAKSRNFHALEEIWPIIVANSYEDILFIEKIERIFLGHREKQRIATLLYPFLEPYKSLEDWDKVTLFLKKILDHEPTAQKARTELIRVYRKKYSDHSLLEHFLKISDLGNNRKPVKVCLTNFERNIVFDTGNYVMHRNWGVGKIVSISENGDSIFVDFKDKKNHKLSIQMAITSLKPLKREHIWVRYYENRDEIQDLFDNNLAGFIRDMVKSYENRMTTGDLKTEVIGEFIKADEWSKWWQKVKSALKQDPNIGMNPKKKDELLYHEQEISFSDELIAKFEAQQDIFKKLDIALQVVKDPDEAIGAAEHFNTQYNKEELSKDNTRKILAYLFLDQLDDTFTKPFLREKASNPNILPEVEVTRKLPADEIASIIRSMSKEECIQLSASIPQLEVKKGWVDLVGKFHPQAIDIYLAILFEVPVKVNKYVWGLLYEKGKISELNLFLETICQKAKTYPEVFIWIMKAILNSPESYEYLKFNRNDLVLRVLRILKPLNKIEAKGNKLKNQAHGILVEKGMAQEIFKEAIENGDEEYARKLYALYKEIPYITDLEKERMLEIISEINTSIEWEDASLEDEEDDDILTKIPANHFLVTRKAINQKKAELEHMINVEMAENSRDIGEAQEKGDLRENAEYKAAMEKQIQIQAAIKRLDQELKNALILEDYVQNFQADKVGVGCSVKLQSKDTGEVITYSILGTWDADTSKNIISYLAPMAKTLIGKTVGDEAHLNLGAQESIYTVLEISRFTSVER